MVAKITGVVYVILLIVSTSVNTKLSGELCHIEPVFVNPVTGTIDNTADPLSHRMAAVDDKVKADGKQVTLEEAVLKHPELFFVALTV